MKPYSARPLRRDDCAFVVQDEERHAARLPKLARSRANLRDRLRIGDLEARGHDGAGRQLSCPLPDRRFAPCAEYLGDGDCRDRCDAGECECEPPPHADRTRAHAASMQAIAAQPPRRSRNPHTTPTRSWHRREPRPCTSATLGYMHTTMPIVAPREGDRVVAQDGDLGCVDRVLRSEAARAIYLVVAVGAVGRR